ncbi:hypothetical protein D3C77_537150 [compost metagenome]
MDIALPLVLDILRGQRLEHRQQGRDANAGADQHHRSCALFGQGEAAQRRANIDPITNLHMVVQMMRSRPLCLDADADVPVAGGAGDAVGPDQRCLIRISLDAHREVLSGSEGYRSVVQWPENEGANVLALLLHLEHLPLMPLAPLFDLLQMRVCFSPGAGGQAGWRKVVERPAQ